MAELPTHRVDLRARRNASQKEIIESYFREYSQREPDELQKFKPNVQFSRQYDYSPKVFQGWGTLHKSLLV